MSLQILVSQTSLKAMSREIKVSGSSETTAVIRSKSMLVRKEPTSENYEEE